MEKFISTDLHMENAFIDKIMGKIIANLENKLQAKLR